MKPFELFTEKGKSTGVWACGRCRVVHRQQDQAEACCQCIDCKEEQRSPHSSRCEACNKSFVDRLNAEHKEKERIAMEKAEIVDGEFGLFYGDTYLRDVEDIDGELYPDDVCPEFCFAAEPILFRKWDLDEITNNEDEQYGLDEYGEVQFTGLPALKKAFDDFNADNEGITMCYTVDHTKKVRTAGQG